MADIAKVKAFMTLTEAYLQYAQKDGVANPSATTNQMMQDLFKNWLDTIFMMVQSFWQPNTYYEVNAVIISPNMPKGFCAFAKNYGTSSIAEPEWADVDGEEVNDGSVTFVMKKMIYELHKVVLDLEIPNKLLITYSDKTSKEIAIVRTINNNAPDDKGNVNIKISEPVIASQQEAETGTDNTKHMTPLRVKQAISAQVAPKFPTINWNGYVKKTGTSFTAPSDGMVILWNSEFGNSRQSKLYVNGKQVGWNGLGNSGWGYTYVTLYTLVNKGNTVTWNYEEDECYFVPFE